ncbi:CotS family spore coat protein [Clostridium swellfunianum]|uniref:CotS family spore coat protein n=1 Tax=Clostridium swellfunianum TaxID=1367462 RepID=UPI00202F0F82|nr:CotS family spore coat protein [Clostridium swellfunianum]MCM0649691.1 CotS family spore coat protein [Clostridium swellfunianum]
MKIDELKQLVEQSYGLEVIELEKIKNVYRIKTSDDDYCLKVIKYEFPHFWFIVGAIKHLQSKGFDRVPEIIKTKEGKDYVSIDELNAYLTKWISARECNYDNPLDVSLAAVKLAELHNKSEGFMVTETMKPRVYWYKWPENFRTRMEEILDFKKKIALKTEKTDFDYLFLSEMNKELSRAERAVENLLESSYMEKISDDIVKSGFCHHDYAHHNVLIEERGSVNIIDFDYCILDTNLHDLASLLIRKMKNGKWDIENAVHILDSYDSVRKIERRDVGIMAAFMEFPQDYWQLGIQYYWEGPLKSEDFFVKKLNKIYEDREEKQEFIEEFRNFKYGH